MTGRYDAEYGCFPYIALFGLGFTELPNNFGTANHVVEQEKGGMNLMPLSGK